MIIYIYDYIYIYNYIIYIYTNICCIHCIILYNNLQFHSDCPFTGSEPGRS